MAISMTELISTSVAVCGIVALLLNHFGIIRLLIKAAKFPGPLNVPVLGSLFFFRETSSGLVDKIMGLLKSYPSPFRVWYGHRLFFFVSDPEQLKIVLNSSSTIERDDLYKLTRLPMGNGLLAAPVDIWRRHRKLMAPTFHSKVLESFMEVFSKQAEIMTKQIRKELGAGEFDMSHYVSLCMIDIVFETTMGLKLEAQENDSHFVNLLDGMIDIANERIITVWLHPDCLFNLTKMGRNMHEHAKYMRHVASNVIRMKRVSCNNRAENESAHKLPAKRKAFLDFLVDFANVESTLTDEELLDEVCTIIITGTHTSASIALYAMVMLACNPEIQERAYRELCEIYGDEVSSETPVRHEDLNRMEYLERVIKETMRLFPVIPMISREVTEDLNIGEYTLPKGATVSIGLLHIHRSEKYWTDPLRFDPERFLPEEVAKRPSYCYLPFSGGPRNCIGSKYAMMVLKVILSTVLRRYVLKKNKHLDPKDIIIKAGFLKHVENMELKISERINEIIEK